jgi:quinol monooxygenase YgiN
MITVVSVLKANEGKQEELERTLRGILPQVESEAGTLAYTLHRDKSEPRKFLFYEKYRDEAALTLHSSTPYFLDLFGRIGPLLDGPPVIELYEPLASIREKS